MPYIDVSETNCLYVAVDEEDARFQKQCEIIKNWQSLNLSALNLIDLPKGFSEKDLKKAKMKLFLHFHPDKNNNSAYSTEAFQILIHAVEFLAFQLDSSISIKNNPFVAKKEASLKHSAQKTHTTPPPVSAEKKAYLTKLNEIAQSGSMTSADEQFFRNALSVHPEYLPLTINEHNLFHFVLDKGGSSPFFQWLISLGSAEEALSKSKDSYDVFSFAFNANRKDCLQILFGIYGIEGFHASSIAYSLSICVLILEEDEKASDTFWFLINELNYIPKNGYIAVSVLDTALSEVGLSTFNRIYDKFKHLLLESDQNYNHNSLINRVLTFNYSEIKLQKMADAGLMQHVTDPLFQNASELNSFLSKKNFQEIIQLLQTKYNLMKSLENLSQKTIEKLSPESLIILLNAELISVEQILQSSWITCIDRDALLSQALLKRNTSAFHAWLKGVEFTTEYLKSEKGQAHLRLMLKYGIVFTEQQLTTIQSMFDAYFTDLAEKRVHYTEHDYRFLPMTTEAWLFPIIECIGRSPNRMACLNKVYEHEVKVVVQADTHFNGSFYRANDSTFSTYEYTETILSSFTPLQFFMIMDKKPLAVLLLSLGVNWKQNLRATIQTGINNPSHYAYNPAKRIREFEIKINPQYVEERSVKILSSDPDAETQKRIIDSKEIIFIHKNDQIEIGFCNTNYKYEQKIVSGVPNIIDAIGQAKLTGKITNSADLDAIERYMVELGICLYSSKYTESTVLDFVKTEIQNTEESRLQAQSRAGASAGDWNEFYDDRSKDVKALLKQIQLNEAESYLYKRTLDADYKTKLSFFGFFTIMNFGFSKKEKITAVRALINFLKNDMPIPESCKPALYQGELGKIAALRDIVFEPAHPQINSSSVSHNR
ncbi:DnaJ domain-containing protein [Legionella sp.]|uniref:DnaJ domain-containing protein n=1 Tax=Legionella sp. TaxID=459 RepID=UPI003C9266E7